MTMLDIIKQVAEASIHASAPAAWFFGEVIGVEPLRVRVDDRFNISEGALVLTREFKHGICNTHVHAVPEHIHRLQACNTHEAEGHQHSLPENDTAGAELSTGEEFYRGLCLGDKLVLLRNHGGQRFLVIGRM